MKTKSTQQEILLNTRASFSKRRWSEKNPEDATPMSEREQLEKACWNGVFWEMVPEILSDSRKSMYLWQINELNSFIQLDLSEYPTPKENYYSLNPYASLPTKSVN
ncbi:MAG: hypothetical protein C5B59_09000 [Bacteroidetes bacterium]|nr:MAG: hypothetical protein C5B59_09000 [Bacteroidota bacterium]